MKASMLVFSFYVFCGSLRLSLFCFYTTEEMFEILVIHTVSEATGYTVRRNYWYFIPYCLRIFKFRFSG